MKPILGTTEREIYDDEHRSGPYPKELCRDEEPEYWLCPRYSKDNPACDSCEHRGIHLYCSFKTRRRRCTGLMTFPRVECRVIERTKQKGGEHVQSSKRRNDEGACVLLEQTNRVTQ